MSEPALISVQFLELASDCGLRNAHVRLLTALEALGASRPGGFHDRDGTLRNITGRGVTAFADVVGDLERWDIISTQEYPDSSAKYKYWLACSLTDLKTLRPLLASTMNSDGRQPRHGGGGWRRAAFAR